MPMRPIPNLLDQTSDSIMEFLEFYISGQNTGVTKRKFRKLDSTMPEMQVMFYSFDHQILLAGIEKHSKQKDYLVDEDPFDEQAPLYFSENDHYVSPIYQLQKLRKAMIQALDANGMHVPSMPWIVLVTNATLINKEDYEDDVWLTQHTVVYDKVDYEAPCGELSDECEDYEAGNNIFKCANQYTECPNFSSLEEKKEDTDDMTNDEFERLLNDFIKTLQDDEKEFADEDKENNEQCENDTENEGKDDKEEGMAPFSEDFDPPYEPTLDDGLRATAYARMRKPKEMLNRLIGCEEIKKQIEQLTTLHRYNRRLLNDNPESEEHEVSMHTIFHGAPGTGKTTLCRLYASLLYEAGALSRGHVVVADRGTFVGNNFGDEEKAVHAVLKAAKGGVLMIDEAYQLNPPHPHDPGKNVLPLMMPYLADENARDIAIVLCGYTEPIEKLLSQNEGLASRFPNRFKFPDFSVPQLLKISKLRIKKYKYHFTPKAWLLYKEVVTNLYNNRDKKSWGNAREIGNLLDQIYLHHAARCERQNVKNKKMLVITVADVKPLQLTSTPKKRSIGFK